MANAEGTRRILNARDAVEDALSVLIRLHDGNERAAHYALGKLCPVCEGLTLREFIEGVQ